MTSSPIILSRPSLTSHPASQKSGFTIIELVIVVVVIAILVAMMLPATRSSRPAARRSQCKNNLKQIALALHNYESTYGALPPAYTVDAHGRPLHSWRTLILPYLDQQFVYDRIDLSKAWDDPANAEAFNTRIPTYNCPEANCPANHTTYRAVVTSSSCIRPTEPRPLPEIAGSHGEKLIVIELVSRDSVPWMAPTDADERVVLGFGPKTELPHAGGLNAAFLDGSVRFIAADTPEAERQALISITVVDE